MSYFRLVHSGKQQSPYPGGSEMLTFSTRSGTRQGVEEHTFRVESQRDLVTWTVPLVQGVNAAVQTIKELSTGKYGQCSRNDNACDTVALMWQYQHVTVVHLCRMPSFHGACSRDVMWLCLQPLCGKARSAG